MSDPDVEIIIPVIGPDSGRTWLSLDALIQEPARSATLSRPEVAELYRQAARLEADLRAQLLAHPTDASRVDDTARLLTLSEVATILTIPESKAYELARRGELPTVAIPGGKYVRVRRADLDTWIDRRVLPLVTSTRDQARVPAAAKTARALTAAARRRDGHHQGIDLSVGGRRAADLGAGSPISDAPGSDAG